MVSSIKINPSQKLYFRKNFSFSKKFVKENSFFKKLHRIQKECYVLIREEDERRCKKLISNIGNHNIGNHRKNNILKKRCKITICDKAKAEIAFMEKNNLNVQSVMAACRKYKISLDTFMDIYNRNKLAPSSHKSAPKMNGITFIIPKNNKNFSERTEFKNSFLHAKPNSDMIKTTFVSEGESDNTIPSKKPEMSFMQEKESHNMCEGNPKDACKSDDCVLSQAEDSISLVPYDTQPEENFIPVSDDDCIIIKEVLAPSKLFEITSNGLPNKTDQFKKFASPPVAANIADPLINKEYTLDTFKIPSRSQVSQSEENFIPVLDDDCIIINEVLAPSELVEGTSNGLPFQVANKLKKLSPPPVASSYPPINKKCKLHTFKISSRSEVIVELRTVFKTEAYLEFDESEFNHIEDTEPSS